ncbi:MAG TPA: hypothetical protein VM122_01355 [Usitatibacter sp.]|nr:hypothetical protein [Usitatibacter sp.]
MMQSKVVAFFAAAFLAVTAFVAPGSAQAAKNDPAFEIPLNSAGAGGTFAGTLRITNFAVVNNALVAVGTVAGTVVNATNGASSVVRTVTIPVITSPTRAAAPSAAAVSCEILHLELGPLDLDLLGLVVHLDRVVLDLTAVPGAGNLLGNLLCAVVNLLNGGGALTQIAGLLNQILGLLGV